MCYVQRVPCCRTGIHSTSRGSTQAWVVSRVVEGGSDQVVKELGALEFAEEVVWKSPVDLSAKRLLIGTRRGIYIFVPILFS